MAFNDVQPASGPFTIALGGSLRVWIQHGGTEDRGDDHGAQWIMAHPLEGMPATLQVSDFAKQRNYEIEQEAGGVLVSGIGDTGIRYWATVRHVGGGATRFNLQGGGNT
jgi:hypothetical protein